MDCTALYNAMLLVQVQAAVDEAAAAVEMAEAEIAQSTAAASAQAAWDAEVEWIYCEGGGSSRVYQADSRLIESRKSLLFIRQKYLETLKAHHAMCVSRRELVSMRIRAKESN